MQISPTYKFTFKPAQDMDRAWKRRHQKDIWLIIGRKKLLLTLWSKLTVSLFWFLRRYKGNPDSQTTFLCSAHKHFHQRVKTNNDIREDIKRQVNICRDKTPPASLSKVGDIEIIISFIISLDNIHYISSHYIQVGVYKTAYGCIQK